MTEPIDNFPQLVYLQELEAKLRQIPPDATEWTETITDAKGVQRTVRRPGSAREQLAAGTSAAARKVFGNWGAYNAVNGQELMTAVVADVADAAGDAELAAKAREALQEWGVDAKALLWEAMSTTVDDPTQATDPARPVLVEVVGSPPRLHQLIRDGKGQVQGSIESDES